ncbi:MAG TPA: protein kinase [Pyrinomonadaceae bacterium]|nr:protein kinase [Pyrinomonadaceae bacterium]
MKHCPACKKSFDETSAFCPEDGEVLQESPDSIVGQVIEGKYRIEGFIAQGGMGAVYRARHILLGDEVVIKTLRPEMRNNSEWLRRFQREGKAARAFRHPNSVTVYDLSAGSDGLIYMVMEYVEGHTLDEELRRRGRFSPAEALEVLEPVADALDAAHKRGVVHRDLKPENIMLGRDDRGHAVVKVLDLGIAKILGADVHAAETTNLTVAGQILGTPYYMSPEQWGELPRDGNPEIDGRTDIYSLGIILFELVAGRKPLGGRTLSELRQKHVAVPVPPLSSIAPEVPEPFSRVVARATAKDRADRPQTPAGLINELRVALGLAPKVNPGAVIITAGGGRLPGAAETNEIDAGTGEAATAYFGNPTDAETAERGHHATALGTDGASAPAPPQHMSSPDPLRPTAFVGPAPGTNADFGEDSGVRQTRAASPGDAGAPAPDWSPFGAGPAGGAVEPTPTATPPRSVVPIVAGAAVLLLLLLGVGGWLALRGRGGGGGDVAGVSEGPAKTGGEGAKTTGEGIKPAGGAAVTAAPAAPVPKVEAMSYWLETFDSLEAPAGERVADPAAALPSGKRFVFHFRPPTRGYLYVVGPGEGNAPTTFLTAKGAGSLASNLVPANSVFTFPSGGAKLRLDERPGADEFTVIFSPTPLDAPAFLNREFLRRLTPAEVRELEELRARGVSEAAGLEVKEEGGERRVAVEVPRDSTGAGRPLVFDVRINHR